MHISYAWQLLHASTLLMPGGYTSYMLVHGKQTSAASGTTASVQQAADRLLAL